MQKGWLRDPDESLHFYFGLHSFTFNLVLTILGVHVPHCRVNRLQQPRQDSDVFAPGLRLGAGTPALCSHALAKG